MARQQNTLEWYQQGTQPFRVRGGVELNAAGVTLASITSITLERRTAENPDVWEDASSEVTVANSVIGNDAVNGGSSNAVVFTVAPGATALVAGDNYRILVKAVRSDGFDWIGEAPLRVMPVAT